MKISIICDEAGKTVIESLCHIAMIHTERKDFIPNMAVTTLILNSIEVEVPDTRRLTPYGSSA